MCCLIRKGFGVCCDELSNLADDGGLLACGVEGLVDEFNEFLRGLLIFVRLEELEELPPVFGLVERMQLHVCNFFYIRGVNKLVYMVHVEFRELFKRFVQ